MLINDCSGNERGDGDGHFDIRMPEFGKIRTLLIFEFFVQ